MKLIYYTPIIWEFQEFIQLIHILSIYNYSIFIYARTKIYIYEKKFFKNPYWSVKYQNFVDQLNYYIYIISINYCCIIYN